MISTTNFSKRKKYSLLLPALLVFFSFGCEPENLNLEDPEQSDRQAKMEDTFSHKAITIEEDPLLATNFSAYRFGHLNDPVFGKTKADLAFNLDLPDPVDFNEDAEVQNVYLEMGFGNGILQPYGDTSEALNITAHPLQEELEPDSNYQTDVTFPFDEDPAGEFSEVPNPSDLSITIPFQNSVGQDLLDIDTAIYNTRNRQGFQQEFPGLYLQVEEVDNYGAIHYFHLDRTDLFFEESGFTQTKLVVETDEDTVTFPVNQNSAAVNLIDHDHSSTPVGEQIEDENDHAETIYIQPLEGVKGNIRFPSLKELAQKEPKVAVHKAELIIPYEEPEDFFSVPSGLNLLESAEDGTNEAVLNFDVATSPEDEKDFRFHITDYIQRQVSNYREDENYSSHGFNVIVPSDNPPQANRLIVPSDNDRRIQLKLWLSETPSQ